MKLDFAAENEAATVAVARLDQIPCGQGRCFLVAGRRIAIFRLRGGMVYAMDNACPHRGGPLADGLVGTDCAFGVEVVVCPLHALRFSLRDGRGLDNELAARTYPAEVRAGVVHVTLR